MKTVALFAASLLLTTTLAYAQDGTPGGHFVQNWDLDGDGGVTLAEATERRGDVFAMADSNSDGLLDGTEYDAFDAMRAAHQDENKGHAGKGKGKGMGKGEEQGMQRAFNDTDGDGQVSQAEFMARVPDWFAMMDGNGDGVVTTDDFGPGN